MVIELVRDNEHSVIEVRHRMLKEEIKAINIPEEEIFKLEIQSVRNELLENYPDYRFVYATKKTNYTKDKYLGEYMEFVARGVKYFNKCKESN